MEEIYIELKKIRPQIPYQTYRTIVGQIKAGDLGGATVGINRLKRRIAREEETHENCRR